MDSVGLGLEIDAEPKIIAHYYQAEGANISIGPIDKSNIDVRFKLFLHINCHVVGNTHPVNIGLIFEGGYNTPPNPNQFLFVLS